MQQRAWQRYARASAWPMRAGCALFWLSALTTLAAAQDVIELQPWPAFGEGVYGSDLLIDPPVVMPVMPVDLPPIADGAYVPGERWEREEGEEDDGGRRSRPYVRAAHQEPLPRPEVPPEPVPAGEASPLQPMSETLIFPTPSCATCGGCGSCGGCVTCEPCVARTRWGRFACGLYQAVCCPDPCYEPHWTGIANAAFWVDSARPVTHVRYRWDASLNVIFPDRATYLWPRVGGLGPKTAPRTLDLHELSMYNEVATGSFAFFTNTPYRSYDTDGDLHAAGFGDLDMGTKSVLFDCELMQITFQFRTFIPIGNAMKGLGTEHVTLEPSLLMALNLAPDTYLQAQLSEWIPISADSGAGAILHYHASLNHVLWHWQPAVPIIGTLEANGWSFQDGSYTDPAGSVHSASGETYVSAGPGVRVVVCDKVHFGIGTAFAVTEDHWGEQSVRSEFCWRF